jgi:hypothetical protein
MPVRITLDNNEVIEAEITLADWDSAFRRALEGNTMIQIEGPDGQVLGINPQRVNVVEATDPRPAAQAPQAQHA